MESLYKQLIIDYSNCIKNKFALKKATYKLKGYNSLCGDIFTIYIEIQNKKIKNISFTGTGCTLSTASSAIMVNHVKGISLKEFLLIYNNLKLTLMKKKNINFVQKELQLLVQIKNLPSRIKCVILSWDILNTLIKKCF